MESMVDDSPGSSGASDGKSSGEPRGGRDHGVKHANFASKDIRLVASVIQPNQQSVIQSTNLNAVQLGKGNVFLLNKGGGVIQAAQGLQAVQVIPKGGGEQKIEYLQLVEADEGEIDTSDPKKRREILARRPSYRKILSELGAGDMTNGSDPEKRHEILVRQPSYRKILTDLGADVAEEKPCLADSPTTSESSQETDSNPVVSAPQNNYSPLLKVIPASIALANSEGIAAGGLQTITMTSAGSTGGAIVHYAQGQEGSQFIVPEERYTAQVVDDAHQKRELRLVKNREAARECRRKKKEYIKCLENRVAVLENQNKALIEELKTLKELYCQKQE